MNITMLENGNLQLSITSVEENQEILDNLESRGFWSVISDLFEEYYTNGSYTPFDAGEGNPFVGLTDAPCIAEQMTVTEDDGNHIIGRLWWYPEYMVSCPLETRSIAS